MVCQGKGVSVYTLFYVPACVSLTPLCSRRTGFNLGKSALLFPCGEDMIILYIGTINGGTWSRLYVGGVLTFYEAEVLGGDLRGSVMSPVGMFIVSRGDDFAFSL